MATRLLAQQLKQPVPIQMCVIPSKISAHTVGPGHGSRVVMHPEVYEEEGNSTLARNHCQ